MFCNQVCCMIKAIKTCHCGKMEINQSYYCIWPIMTVTFYQLSHHKELSVVKRNNVSANSQ